MSPTIDKLIAWGGAITLLLAGALGIQSGWPRPSEEMDNGRLVILGLSGLSSLAGLLLFLALVAHRWVPAESPGNRLARVFRPMIDRGQMLYQDAGLPNAYPDVHGNFDGRVGRWESEAGKAVARYAGEYQDVFQTAISGDIYVQEANSGPIDLGAQHRRLYRALAVLRGLVEAVPPSQIHFAAPDEAIEGSIDRRAEGESGQEVHAFEQHAVHLITLGEQISRNIRDSELPEDNWAARDAQVHGYLNEALSLLSVSREPVWLQLRDRQNEPMDAGIDHRQALCTRLDRSVAVLREAIGVSASFSPPPVVPRSHRRSTHDR